MSEKVFDVAQFHRTILDTSRSPMAVLDLLADYRLMLGAVLETILQRYERDADYPFIDTKLSLLDGHDFDPADPLRGKNTLYGWIQGRGLEALAGHHDWLTRSGFLDASVRDGLCQRVRRMLREVLERMETLRSAMGGRLFFAMTPQGQALRIEHRKLLPHTVAQDAPTTMSELFYVKGLLAAGSTLGDASRVQLACQWFDRIGQDILADRCQSDQQSLDPGNAAIGIVPGRKSHGFRMIGIGACATFLERTGDERYLQLGLQFIDYILLHHVNLSGDTALSQRYDMWEFINATGQPYVEEGNLLRSDPGHATEFVGLATKLLHAAKQHDLLERVEPARLKRYYDELPRILHRNFSNGFSPRGLGIVKGFDLASRKVLYADMPWWPLPETLRAALGVCLVVPSDQRLAYVDIARRCSNAFFTYFVRPELGLMATQTLSAEGKPVNVVPATPDADPGYHTGLSIIDCLDWIGEMMSQTGEE